MDCYGTGVATKCVIFCVYENTFFFQFLRSFFSFLLARDPLGAKRSKYYSLSTDRRQNFPTFGDISYQTKASIIWKTSDRRAKRSEIWDLRTVSEHIWSTFGLAPLKNMFPVIRCTCKFNLRKYNLQNAAYYTLRILLQPNFGQLFPLTVYIKIAYWKRLKFQIEKYKVKKMNLTLWPIDKWIKNMQISCKCLIVLRQELNLGIGCSSGIYME